MEHSVILFDGVCNLCNQSVLFVIKRDLNDRFRFSPLQGDYAMSHLPAAEGFNDRPDSVILIENEHVYTESTAALRIARKLSGLWPLLYGFIIVPPFIRNYIYRWIAGRRYSIWGKTESCMVPTPELKSKFL
ncbi:thiol-disulfide oxidoreductase DCC family protein [Pedobacter duraquae]|uniref:Putative DCC family thiol-disulfide oxidoreductase YuxK n=1 Tax=Pedobacter duraquae TaxID=425511 RepID=A0A4R6IRD9_9SPHI|nr:DCC1-like thiol-disulfide oxidoreductase family protein [Pedobacter duraquae]TDO24969.1 putative DCC family thiol-disulfide oxidoreductase YuxK [Pedobacter duraquae]